MALTRITKGVIKPNENYDTHNINSTGIVTAIGLDINGNGDISGNLSIGGVLTYEDVTSIDSVGIITAQSDIHVGAGVSAVGVGTFGGLDVNGNGDVSGNLVVGSLLTASGLDINGDIDVDGHTNLDNVSIAGITTIAAGGKLSIGGAVPSKMLELYSGSTVASMHESTAASYVEAQFKNSARHYIVGLRPDQSSAFCILDNTSGSGGVLLKASGHTVTLDHDLDVDGHTNLDNVSIAGITTTTENIRIQADNKYLTVGASNQIGVVHTGGEAFITNSSGHFTHRSDVHKWENYAGSSEYLRITSGGQVRIANTNLTTNTRADNLIVGTTSGHTGITIFSGTGETGNIYFGDTNTTGLGNRMGTITYDHSENYMRFSTSGNQERLRITSDGNIITNTISGGVGIRTDNPTTTFHVRGAGVFTSQTGGTITNGLFLDPGDTGAGNRPDIMLKGSGSTALNNFAMQVYYNNGSNKAFHLRYDGGTYHEGRIAIGVENPNNFEGTADDFVISRSHDAGITISTGSAGSTNTGSILFAEGTAGTQDKNRGAIKYKHGDDYFAFHTNYNERLRITSSGDVLTSGNTQLFGSNTSDGSDNKAIMINGGGAVSDTRGGYLLVHGNEHSSNPGITRLHAGNVGTAYIAFNTAGSERLRITSGGEVNIGSNLTQTSYLCEISGAYNKDGMRIVSGAPNYQDPFVVASSTGGERFRVRGDGKVGIGHHLKTQINKELTIRPANDGGILLGRPGDTVAPINKALTITTTTTGSEAYHTKYHTYNCNSIFATYEGGGTGGNFIFKTGVGSGNETERLYIKSDGKIGINNTNPTHPLHIVNTSSTFNSASLIKGDNSTSGQGAYATFTNTTDSKSAYFGLDGAGLFAIDPGAALVGTSGSEPIIFATNGNAERFRINASTSGTILVQQASGADVFYVNSDSSSQTRNTNSLTHINYGLAIGKSRTQNGGDTAYGTSAVWTPYYAGEGEKCFGIDPSWSLPELRKFFGTDNVEWYAEENAPGGYCIKVTGATNVGSNYNSGFPYLPIDDDDQFFQEMWIRVDSGTSVNHYGGSIQLDKNFANPTGNPGSFGYELMVNHTTNSTTWERRTATLGPNHGSSYGSFRSGFTGGKRKYVTPQLLLNYQLNSGSRVCYISGWAWYRRRSRGNTHFGSISKGSGSFQIKHPLEAKKDTHYLRHSFIEGPKCDNIYRGKATLSSGTATVNLDTEGTMTEGTFVALNDNVQCYTSNETGWSAVKGSVSGNILTITAQDNTSTDTISWMVVGERKDDEIKSSELTDSSGKLLVEPQVDQQYVGLSTTPMIAPGMES